MLKSLRKLQYMNNLLLKYLIQYIIGKIQHYKKY